MQIHVLIWAVYFGGAWASTYFFGLPGRIAYLVIVGAIVLAFNRHIAVALTHLVSKLGWMKSTIDKMPNTITLTRGDLRPLAIPTQRSGTMTHSTGRRRSPYRDCFRAKYSSARDGSGNTRRNCG